MWSFEHTESTAATPEQIWAYYADPESAPSWDPLVAKIEINGPFATGTTGTNTSTTGQRVKFILSEVTPYSSYTEVNPLPLAQLSWTHRITPTSTGCTFTHGVILSGPLSGLYALLLGRSFKQGMPVASRNLARRAEQEQSHSEK